MTEVLYAFTDKGSATLILAGRTEQSVLYREHAEPQVRILVGLCAKLGAQSDSALSVDVTAKRDVRRLAQRLIISQFERAPFLIRVASAGQKKSRLALSPRRRYPNIRQHERGKSFNSKYRVVH